MSRHVRAKESHSITLPMKGGNREYTKCHTSTNSKVAKAIILPTLPSEASDSKPSRVEVICRSNQTRGFSEQVSNRIAVPQRKSTLDLYEQKWNSFREWCELNRINPHTPTVPMIAEFLLHLFRDKQLATITIKGYRSALSSLMASRGSFRVS